MLKAFRHHAAELRLHCGDRALDALPTEIVRGGCHRAIVFCGATLAGDGTLERVKDLLGARFAGAFEQVEAHSPVRTVEEGARRIAISNADAVVALGGGSAIVTARAAGILAAEGGDVRQLCTRMGADGTVRSPRLVASKLPQFVVPTTPTTAIVKAGCAVHDDETGERLALFDPKARAKAVFVDATLLQAAPASLVRAASLNALTMAVEGLESDESQPLADAALMHALRLLGMHLPLLSADAGDVDVRLQLTLAAILCGQGTDIAGGGLASVLGHAIGPRSHVPNGIVNAMVLPWTMRFNLPATHSRLWKVAASLPATVANTSAPSAAIAAVEALLAASGIPSGLRQSGLRQEQFGEVADHASSDFFLRRNPRRVEGRSDLLSLLAASW